MDATRSSAAESAATARERACASSNVNRAGFEIVYVPELSGWQVRSGDSAMSDESYRSIFLARKAADDLAAAASAKELSRAD